MFPSLSSNHKPFLEFLHSFRSSLSSKSLRFLHSESLHSSGGNLPLSINLSKCFFKTPSIPEGRLGNIPAGLLQTLCTDSQKHLGHSCIRFSVDGESLNGMLTIMKCLIKRLLTLQTIISL